MQNNSALLIIDLQNDFVKIKESPVFIPSAVNIIPVILKLREFFEINNQKIINIVTVHSKDNCEWGNKDKELERAYCIENSNGVNIINELFPFKSNEIIVSKKYYSGFFETELLDVLKKNNIENIYFTGLTTGCCVSSTARDAYNYKFNLFFVEDALTSTSVEAHKNELLFFQKSLGVVINSNEVEKHPK